MAAIHRGEHVGNILGRILEIGVNRDNAPPPQVFEAGHDGDVLSEIRVEQDHTGDEGPALELLPEQRRRAILAAVVDEDDFVRKAQGVERSIETVKELRERLLLVVDGYDDRDVDGLHAARHRGPR